MKLACPLLVGSDAPEPNCPPGWALHQELELLVESGLSPADALAAATLQNARVVGMDADLGSITPGKIADIVILEADPTTDVRNTRKIYAVIHDGVEVFSLDHEGALYAIRPDGRMHWYKEENRSGANGPNAQSGWAPDSGSQISFGWEIFETIFYGGDGIIYASRPMVVCIGTRRRTAVAQTDRMRRAVGHRDREVRSASVGRSSKRSSMAVTGSFMRSGPMVGCTGTRTRIEEAGTGRTRRAAGHRDRGNQISFGWGDLQNCLLWR